MLHDHNTPIFLRNWSQLINLEFVSLMTARAYETKLDFLLVLFQLHWFNEYINFLNSAIKRIKNCYARAPLLILNFVQSWWLPCKGGTMKNQAPKTKQDKLLETQINWRLDNIFVYMKLNPTNPWNICHSSRT